MSKREDPKTCIRCGREKSEHLRIGPDPLLGPDPCKSLFCPTMGTYKKAAGADWNAALLALGRRWQAWMMIYTPEELHDLRKEIYALWRGEKKEPLFDENGAQIGEDPIGAAIDAGLRGEES